MNAKSFKTENLITFTDVLSEPFKQKFLAFLTIGKDNSDNPGRNCIDRLPQIVDCQITEQNPQDPDEDGFIVTDNFVIHNIGTSTENRFKTYYVETMELKDGTAGDLADYRSGTVNSKSFVGKVLLRIKWKFELYYTL